MTMIAFLPPSSRHDLELVGGGLVTPLACLARAGEGDHRDVRVLDDRLAHLLAEPVYDVDDALWRAQLAEEGSTKRGVSSGVSSAGLNTTVLPQTSAGAIFQVGIAIGKFHGVITPTTPTGIRTLIWNLSGSSRRVVWPKRRRPSPAM